MPLNHLHKDRKRKNYILLAVLIALFVLLFAITMMRLGQMPVAVG
jgi:hypothetical protein